MAINLCLTRTHGAKVIAVYNVATVEAGDELMLPVVPAAVARHTVHDHIARCSNGKVGEADLDIPLNKAFATVGDDCCVIGFAVGDDCCCDFSNNLCYRRGIRRHR